YTVTVANTVTDLSGSALATPATATFLGFEQPASVKLNEVNANIAGGCDLVELRVLSDGTLRGIRLQERGADVIQLPSATVAKNDIVVVHFNNPSGTCNPGSSTNETTGIAQNPAATFTRNYDTAWDMYSTDTGITATDNVIGLFDRFGTMVDAMFFDDDMAGNNVAAASESAAVTVVLANMWQNVGGGTPANGYIDDDFRLNAVLDSDSALTVAHTGANSESMRRVDNTDENDKADWAQGVNTWGLINVGQTVIP
nr:hypothetical protein [Deltaproteobacteria bacterium]